MSTTKRRPLTVAVQGHADNVDAKTITEIIAILSEHRHIRVAVLRRLFLIEQAVIDSDIRDALANVGRVYDEVIGWRPEQK